MVAALAVELEYTNADKTLGKPNVFSLTHNVHVVIRVKADAKTYAGPGPQTMWITYPFGPSNRKSYHLVTRYRQGVM